MMRVHHCCWWRASPQSHDRSALRCTQCTSCVCMGIPIRTLGTAVDTNCGPAPNVKAALSTPSGPHLAQSKARDLRSLPDRIVNKTTVFQPLNPVRIVCQEIKIRRRRCLARLPHRGRSHKSGVWNQLANPPCGLRRAAHPQRGKYPLRRRTRCSRNCLTPALWHEGQGCRD